MVKQNTIKVFEEKSVRTVWDSDKGGCKTGSCQSSSP